MTTSRSKFFHIKFWSLVILNIFIHAHTSPSSNILSILYDAGYHNLYFSNNEGAHHIRVLLIPTLCYDDLLIYTLLTCWVLTAIISHFGHQLLGNKLSFVPCSMHILFDSNKFHKFWMSCACRNSLSKVLAPTNVT